MNAIEVESLTKLYGKLRAVDDVSFQVKKGEVFGFLGPNGAGKTTTINALCTLLKPTSGRATVGGFDVVKQSRDVQRCIGLVFQDSTVDEYLTAEQNLRFHGYAYGVPKKIIEERITELMALVELSDRRKSKVATYSGGMKRRLELARGLLHHPRILFLDEPTLGLDPQTRRHIWDYVLELRKEEELTIFLTTHYMDEAEHCDRIAVIDRGKIIALDTPDKLKDDLGGDLVTLETEDREKAITELKDSFNITPDIGDIGEAGGGIVTFSVPRGDVFLPDFIRSFQSRLLSINVRRPTLDDVFLSLTGHEIREQDMSDRDQLKRMMRPGH